MIVLALAVAGLLVAQPPGSHDSPPLAATKREPASMREAGLRGLVYDQGRWVSPDEIVSRETADQRLNRIRADYKIRRDRAPGTAEGPAHTGPLVRAGGPEGRVTRPFPGRHSPRPRRYRRSATSWNAVRQWLVAVRGRDRRRDTRGRGPSRERTFSGLAKFATWRKWLVDPQHKDEAVKALAEVRDPRAIPSLRRSFRDDDSWEQTWTVRLLDRIDAPKSSQILAEVSVFGVDEQVRNRGTPETGRARSPDLCRPADQLAPPADPLRGRHQGRCGSAPRGRHVVHRRTVLQVPLSAMARPTCPTAGNAASDAMSAMNQGMLRAIRDRERGRCSGPRTCQLP